MLLRLWHYCRGLLGLRGDPGRLETSAQDAPRHGLEEAVRAIAADAVQRVSFYRRRLERLRASPRWSGPATASVPLFVAACVLWGALLFLLASLLR